MFELFQYDFMVRAFIAGVVIAAVAPLIGNFLVIRRFSLIADTLSHVALAGVALGLFLETAPLITTVIFTAAASLAIERLRTSNKIPAETVLAMFLPGGLALSIVLLSLAHGLNTNLMSYLFGSIATVKPEELWFIVGFAVIIIVLLFFLYKKLLFASFDEESAHVAGVPVQTMNTILIVCTAVTVALTMRVVGVLLIGALMVIPVVSGMQMGRSFRHSVVLSVLFAQAAVIAGLYAAYYLNLPAGGTIVLVSLALFACTVTFKKIA